MLNQEQITLLEPNVKTLQIICFGLIMGVATATLMLCFVVHWENANARPTFISVGALGVGLLTLCMSFVLPGIVSRSATSAAAEQLNAEGSRLDSNQGLKQLASVFQSKTIVGYALIEGGAFLNLMIFLLDVSLINLGFVIVTVVVMALLVPRGESLYSWVSDQISEFGSK